VLVNWCFFLKWHVKLHSISQPPGDQIQEQQSSQVRAEMPCSWEVKAGMVCVWVALKSV